MRLSNHPFSICNVHTDAGKPGVSRNVRKWGNGDDERLKSRKRIEIRAGVDSCVKVWNISKGISRPSTRSSRSVNLGRTTRSLKTGTFDVQGKQPFDGNRILNLTTWFEISSMDRT